MQKALRQRRHRQSGGQSCGQEHGGDAGTDTGARSCAANDEHIQERG